MLWRELFPSDTVVPPADFYPPIELDEVEHHFRCHQPALVGRLAQALGTAPPAQRHAALSVREVLPGFLDGAFRECRQMLSAGDPASPTGRRWRTPARPAAGTDAPRLPLPAPYPSRTPGAAAAAAARRAPSLAASSYLTPQSSFLQDGDAPSDPPSGFYGSAIPAHIASVTRLSDDLFPVLSGAGEHPLPPQVGRPEVASTYLAQYLPALGPSFPARPDVFGLPERDAPLDDYDSHQPPGMPPAPFPSRSRPAPDMLGAELYQFRSDSSMSSESMGIIAQMRLNASLAPGVPPNPAALPALFEVASDKSSTEWETIPAEAQEFGGSQTLDPRQLERKG